MIPVKKIGELTLEHSGGDEESKHISAASALLLVDRTLFVVADDERQLGVFGDEGRSHGHLVQILEGKPPPSEEERKKNKPDLESACLIPPFGSHAHGGLLALGSGSSEDRERGAFVPLSADATPADEARTVDLSRLYAALRSELPELNIEGAAVSGGLLHLLQRGNNGEGRNARIEFDLAAVQRALESQDALPETAVGNIVFYDLGRLRGVKLCFSDASPLPDGRIVFSCSAEDSDGSGDGPTVGSALGMMTAERELGAVTPVDIDVKLEGMTAHVRDDRIRVLLVTDADDPSLPSPLLEAYV